MNDLVATYSVMNVLLSLATLGGGRADRARPKSQTYTRSVEEQMQSEQGATLRSQLAFKRRLLGLRSRWSTSAEWRAFRARSVCIRDQ